ncbi:MAG: hypothetical protein EPO21_20340 [Chloroflexota bacterium]|nr:MAG: hypothetical protein EPO21_20340 [Chloroflexota bacterium]
MIRPREHGEMLSKLEQIERKLRQRDVINFALRGGCLALGINVLLTLSGKALGFGSTELLLSISGVIVLLLTSGAAMLAIVQRRTLSHVARICDRQLVLQERLATALEVIASGKEGALLEAQVLDAQRVLNAINVERAFGIRWPVVPSAIALFLLSVLVTTSQLPYPLTELVTPPTLELTTTPAVGLNPSSVALIEASNPTGDQELLEELETQAQGFMDDIANGQLASVEIIDRIFRAEMELRPLLTRSDAEIREPATRLSNRLTSLRQSAELSESISQRDYATVTSHLQALASRLTTLSNDERLLITLILASGSRTEVSLQPDIARYLQQSSTAVALVDRDQLAATLQGLSSTSTAPEAALEMAAPEEATNEATNGDQLD